MIKAYSSKKKLTMIEINLKIKLSLVNLFYIHQI